MSMEEQSMETKLARKDESQFEEELNNQHEADDDHRFYEDDSDDDEDDDFSKYSDAVEGNCWQHCAIYTDQENVENRRCLNLRLCHKDQHKAEFQGLPIFELFKVRVQLNKNLKHTSVSMHGRIYGEIATFRSKYDRYNPFSVSYYTVIPELPYSIDLDADRTFVFLSISGPDPRPPICGSNNLTLDFAFKIDGKDLFSGDDPHENPRLFGDGGCNAGTMLLRSYPGRGDRGGHGPYIGRMVVGNICSDAVLMVGYYSVYYGSWATIDVKMLKGGVGKFYGVIVARPCVFTSRIRLLRIERHDHDGKLVDDESKFVKLTRSVVGVPSYSSLIIGAKLYDEDGELICRGKTAFAAKESGEETRSIFYNGVETLVVSVRWKCQF